MHVSRIRGLLLLAGLIAALALALATACASAGKLSISNKAFRITWRELVFFDHKFGALSRDIGCPVTLEGSFHSASILKRLVAPVGYVTRAVTKSTSCTGAVAGTAQFLPESLPWGMEYEGFSGTLPNISSFRILFDDSVSFEMTIGGIECLFKEENLASIRGEFHRVGGGQMLTFNFDRGWLIELQQGGFLCGEQGGLEFAEAGPGPGGQVFLLGTTSRIILSLI